MVVAGIVMMVLFAIIFIGSLVYLILRTRKIAISKTIEIFNFKKEFIFAGILDIIASISFALFFVGVSLYCNWAMLATEWLALIFGGFFTIFFLLILYLLDVIMGPILVLFDKEIFLCLL